MFHHAQAVREALDQLAEMLAAIRDGEQAERSPSIWMNPDVTIFTFIADGSFRSRLLGE
ncbi:hypothetical protein [Rhizobium sp. BK060]|uniref:hypothetical protein n=1 Tax=Rhizobium sp. BK060 TaxID=2587096 RepID=UPI0016133ED5|nr:hypothetical protein [Rhizobium sp. BK060]MBB3398830.1 hypothetical protein [Rhizobium sp. BK060]